MAGTLDGRMRRETPESLQSDPEAPVSSTKLPGAVGRRWGRSVRGAGSLPVHGLSSRQLCGRGCPSVRPVNPEICPGTRQRWPRHLRPKHFPVSWGPEPLPPPLCRPSGMRLSLPRLLPFPFPDALILSGGRLLGCGCPGPGLAGFSLAVPISSDTFSGGTLREPNIS